MNYAPELLAAPQVARYRIVSLLGKGATSLVYKAFDAERDFTVALKTLKFHEHDDVYRIKQEFRFFRDIHHANLVTLYDLYVDERHCFYTMELIEGRDFVSFVRDRPDRLPACLSALADGLSALHELGRLHRDLKPSNVLVEPHGRPVLLDFGLATEGRTTGSIRTVEQLYAGTPAYMAPEQLIGQPASEATDRHALGVILYESVTGRRPYPDATPVAQYEAQKARAVAAIGPEHSALAELAMGLLSFDPKDRPLLSEIRLVASAETGTALPPRGASMGGRRFVGREAELTRLKQALARTLSGHRVAVHVCGASGVGKTTLIERFLAHARSKFGAITLRSRCHYQESVRYNAVDGLIDMLSRYLMLQNEARLAQLAPDDLPALITMFPVLGRVPFPFRDFDGDSVATDPQHAIQQALGALCELFRRIAADRPVILWIDDLQWSDAGSLPVLREIAAAVGSGPVLPIFSYKLEDLQPGAAAASLQPGGADVETEQILMEPLDAQAVGALVASLLPPGAATDPAWVADIAQQSAGLPFFVAELAASWQQRPARGHEAIGAAGLLDRRLRALPAAQRAVLEIVAVAGRPLAEETLVKVCAREATTAHEIYHLLHGNLLRKTETDGRPAVETYHDRVRVAVLGSLDPAERRLRHRALADELAGAAELDHPLLVDHLVGAGEPLRAATHAILAGRGAAGRFAFDRAVEFFLLATRLRGEDTALALELAGALADAGRCGEAGALFLREARGSGVDRQKAAQLESRAAQQFLFSGRVAAALAIYSKIFVDLGIPFPRTLRAALIASVSNRLIAAVKLPLLRVRAEAETSRPAMARVDTLWAASKGFLMVDYAVGDAMFSRYLREAIALGERSRVVRGLALEAAVLVNIGQRWTLRRSDALLRRAEALAAGSTDPYDAVVVQTCRATMAWSRGRWIQAADLAQEAVALHRRDCRRYQFEVPISLSYRVSALVLQGAIKQVKAETLDAIEDAKRRGDFYVTDVFRSGYLAYIALADDDPERAIADSAALVDQAPTDRFTSMHWLHFIATVNALVYADRGWEAWALVERQWPMIQATGFLRLCCVGAHLREIRARAALKAACDGPAPRALAVWTRARLLGVAREDARRIEAAGALSHAAATAASIRAGIAALERDAARRQAELEAARVGFAAAGMRLHQAAAALQLASSAAEAAMTMAEEGVRRPDRMAAFLMFAS